MLAIRGVKFWMSSERRQSSIRCPPRGDIIETGIVAVTCIVVDPNLGHLIWFRAFKLWIVNTGSRPVMKDS